MKMKLPILFIFSVVPFMAYSQGKSCDCLANLNETIKKRRRTMPGSLQR